jgi:hypothetical protein
VRFFLYREIPIEEKTFGGIRHKANTWCFLGFLQGRIFCLSVSPDKQKFFSVPLCLCGKYGFVTVFMYESLNLGLADILALMASLPACELSVHERQGKSIPGRAQVHIDWSTGR